MSAVRVVKLGGSLLDDPALPARLPDWLAAQSPARNLLVVGGGPLVEALRGIDRTDSLGPETAHWLAVKMMRVTAKLAKALVPKACWVDRLADWLAVVPARPHGDVEVGILDPWEFLQSEEAKADLPPLPHSWDVTSDSIAARAAWRSRADELVLLKSALPPQGDVEAAARAGYVDRYFPRAARGLSVRCVNLRDERAEERVLR